MPCVALIAIIGLVIWIVKRRGNNKYDAAQQPDEVDQPVVAQQQWGGVSGMPGQHPAAFVMAQSPSPPLYNTEQAFPKPSNISYTSPPASSGAYGHSLPGGTPTTYDPVGYGAHSPGPRAHGAELPVDRPDGELRELQ